MVYTYSQLSFDQATYRQWLAPWVSLPEPLLWLNIPDMENGGVLKSIQSVELGDGRRWQSRACGEYVANTPLCNYRPDEMELVVQEKCHAKIIKIGRKVMFFIRISSKIQMFRPKN